MAVCRHSPGVGRYDLKQEKFEKAEAYLRAALIKAGKVAAGPALYAQYNSPSAFPPLRRNEVLIPLVAAE